MNIEKEYEKLQSEEEGVKTEIAKHYSPSGKEIEYPVGTHIVPKVLIKQEFKSKFRIESTDGSSDNTTIYYEDQKLEGVLSLHLSIDADSNHSVATLVVLRPLLNIAIPPECVRVDYVEDPVLSELVLKNMKQNVYDNNSIPEEDFYKNSST